MPMNPWDEPLGRDEPTAERMIRNEQLTAIVMRCAEPLLKACADVKLKCDRINEALDRMGSAIESASPEDLVREIKKTLT